MNINDVIKYQTVDYICPRCGNYHPQTVGWLDTHSQIHCGCGENIPIDRHNYQQQRHVLEARFQQFVEEPAVFG